jgi:hypothetical protein
MKPHPHTLQKVTLEFDDEIMVLEGMDAVLWINAADATAGYAYFHGCNAFDKLDVTWDVTKKDK